MLLLTFSSKMRRGVAILHPYLDGIYDLMHTGKGMDTGQPHMLSAEAFLGQHRIRCGAKPLIVENR